MSQSVEADPCRLTVLMSVYNAMPYLKEAVGSILGQTYRHFQLMIVNDASTDESISYLESLNDNRIKIIHNSENIGLTRSLNKGIGRIETEFIARADADDVYHSERFEKQIKFMDENSSVALCAALYSTIDADGAPVDNYGMNEELPLKWRLLWDSVYPHISFMFRRSIVSEVGMYNEDFRYAQDYDLIERITKKHRIELLPDVLVYHRVHGGNVSITKRAQQRAFSDEVSARFLSRFIGEDIDAGQAHSARTLATGYSRLDIKNKQTAMSVVMLALAVVKKKFTSSDYKAIRNNLSEILLIQSTYYSYVAWNESAFFLRDALKLNPALLFCFRVYLQSARVIVGFVKSLFPGSKREYA